MGRKDGIARDIHSQGCIKEQQVRSPCSGAVDLQFRLNVIPVPLIIDGFSNLISTMQTIQNLQIPQVNPIPSIVTRILTVKIRCTVLFEIANVKRTRV